MQFSPQYPFTDIYANDISKYKFFHRVLERDWAVVLYGGYVSDTPVSAFLQGLGLDKLEPLSHAEGQRTLWLVYDLKDALLYVSVSQKDAHQRYSIHVASSKKSIATKLNQKMAELLPFPAEVEDEVEDVSMSFWTQTNNGPTAYERFIAAPAWPTIKDNYPERTSSELQKLVDINPPFENAGRLLLGWGQPGTGKTTFIRSLCRAWRSWCDPQYIVDPEQFFGDASYMMNTILANPLENSIGSWSLEIDDEWVDASTIRHNHDIESPGVIEVIEPKWRLLIAEDADDFLMSDAREAKGQALARLLNLADGMIGQGLNLLMLITTNQDIKDLHPALKREGRCMANLHFDKFTRSEAVDWLRRNEIDLVGVEDSTLARLFELTREARQISSAKELATTGQYV